jgi:hypothetical protein
MLQDSTQASDQLTISKNGKVAHQESLDSIIANGKHLEYHMHIVLRDKDGNIKDERKIRNTVTTAGKNMIADRLLAAPTLGVPTHMGIGTGTGGTTTLTTELDRNALTSKNRSNAVVTMVGDWAAGDGTGAITEAGVFDASSAGNMHLYQSFSVINKGAADTLSISWTLTIS